MNDKIFRAIAAGVLALGILMGVYFGLLTLVSDWAFAREQFDAYWPYIIALAAGFGIQVALFVYLHRLVHGTGAHAKVVAVSGTASATAMVSCCAHYLVILLPVLGATGLVTLVSQYQVELFWVGLVSNAAGIAYIGKQLAAAVKEHAQCVVPV